MTYRFEMERVTVEPGPVGLSRRPDRWDKFHPRYHKTIRRVRMLAGFGEAESRFREIWDVNQFSRPTEADTYDDVMKFITCLGKAYGDVLVEQIEREVRAILRELPSIPERASCEPVSFSSRSSPRR